MKRRWLIVAFCAGVWAEHWAHGAVKRDRDEAAAALLTEKLSQPLTDVEAGEAVIQRASAIADQLEAEGRLPGPMADMVRQVLGTGRLIEVHPR